MIEKSKGVCLVENRKSGGADLISFPPFLLSPPLAHLSAAEPMVVS